MEDLPGEITLKIFSYLPPESLCKLSGISKYIKVFADDEILWKHLYDEMQAKNGDVKLSIYASWKENYKILYELSPIAPWIYKSTLDLSNRKLTRLASRVKNYTFLTRILLNNNGLTHIPSSIGELKSLKYLKADHNELTEIPKSISKLSKLKYLYLNANKIISLPIDLGKVHSLKHLDISKNPLIEFPDSIDELRKLEFLSFYHDDEAISKFKEKFSKMISKCGLNGSYKNCFGIMFYRQQNFKKIN